MGGIKTLLRGGALSAMLAGALAPAVAEAGQCYGRVAAPVAERHVQRVLVRAAHTETRWTPAVTRWHEKRVLVKAAWTETVHAPAVYRTVNDTVVEPGRRRVVHTAPTYRRVVERVMISPSRLVWRPASAVPGYGAGEPGATMLHATGEVWCRVKIPARYVTKVRHVKVSDGCACEVQGPPVRRRVARRVLARPAHDVQRVHPAIYKTHRWCEVVAPARARTVHVPAVYRTVTHVRRHEQAAYAPVLCPEGGLAPWATARLQAQLNARGYPAGPEDGVASPQTYQALNRFQREHGLAVGPITHESARALGVIR